MIKYQLSNISNQDSILRISRLSNGSYKLPPHIIHMKSNRNSIIDTSLLPDINTTLYYNGSYSHHSLQQYIYSPTMPQENDGHTHLFTITETNDNDNDDIMSLCPKQTELKQTTTDELMDIDIVADINDDDDQENEEIQLFDEINTYLNAMVNLIKIKYPNMNEIQNEKMIEKVMDHFINIFIE